MLEGLIVGVVVGWFLSLFGFDDIVIRGVWELTNRSITNAGYYTIFALLGILGGSIKKR